MNLIFACAIAVVFMLIVPSILIIVLKNYPKVLKIITLVFSIFYFIALFVGTAAAIDINNNHFSLTFDFSKNWFSLYFILFNFGIRNMLINIFMLMPLGFIVYVFCNNHKIIKTVIFAFLVSLVIELYQFILPIARNTEITDIIFNTLGGFISAIYIKLLDKFLINKNKKIEN